MPTVNLNRKEFERLVGKKLELEKLKDRISMLGTDLEGIDEKEITVEVFPNRPDMLSEQGFARAFSSFIKVKKGLRIYKVGDSKERVVIEESVRDVRPFTACAIVKSLKLDDERIREIIQIQEKLHITYGRNRKKVAIGIYPLEKIKMPIRYKAVEPSKIRFKALDDSEERNADEILDKHPAGREYGHLLKGKKRYPVFVDSNDKILSMPPIINSEDTGKIREETRDVFIECSGFDFEILSKCLNIIITALADMEGKIYSMELVYGKSIKRTPNLEAWKMKLDLKYANKMLGLELKEKDVRELLERMGYDYGKGIVLVPAYRADILHEIDIVEDIAIAYGYENFKIEIPKISSVAEENIFEIFKNKIKEILIGLGFLECKSYSLSSEEILNKKMNIKMDLIKVENAINLDYSVLRSWVLPALMEILARNKRYEYPQRLFEIGKCFNEDKELDRLAIVSAHKEANFTEIKQVLDAILAGLNLKYMVEETEHGSFIDGRCGRVIIKGNKIAYIGEINPVVLSNFNLEVPVSGFELNLSELFKIL